MTQDSLSSAVYSMTGFGRAVLRSDEETIEVDARSVNHKSLKLSNRVPEAFISLLPKLEQELKERLHRGSVSVHVRYSRASSDSNYSLNLEQLEAYKAALSKSESFSSSSPTLGDLLSLPGVVQEKASEPIDLEASWSRLQPIFTQAIAQLLSMRAEEGKGIVTDVCEALDGIEAHCQTVETLIPTTLENYQEKLKSRIAKLLKGSALEPDPKDLAQQLAFFADRSDISEELQRMKAHVVSMRSTLKEGGVIGRKLEFLSQEMQREANTMVSKSHGLEIVNTILAMKLLVERIREQAANIE